MADDSVLAQAAPQLMVEVLSDGGCRWAAQRGKQQEKGQAKGMHVALFARCPSIVRVLCVRDRACNKQFVHFVSHIHYTACSVCGSVHV